MVTPVIEKIKDYPGFEFDALTISPQVTDIMQNSGNFNEVFIIDFMKEGLSESLEKVKVLRKKKYDLSILVFPSNHYKYHLVHFMIGAKKRFGTSYTEKNFPNLSFLSGRLLPEDRSLHAIEQNFRLFESALGRKIDRSFQMKINLIDKDRGLADEFIIEKGLAGKILVGIHPGSDTLKNMEQKRWSPDKYADLMRMYSKDPRIHFLIFGGRPERKLNDTIRGLSPKNSTAVKGIHFFHSAAVIEKCSAFICGDTGLMHTASALNIPVIAIFGPTSSVYTKPLNEGSVVIKKDYPCIPCYEYSRTPLFCDQDRPYKCLRDIETEEVAEALNEKLKTQE